MLLIAVCLGGLLLSNVSAEKVFYVKPTVPTTECPSGDSPCHSLQYYANHSSHQQQQVPLPGRRAPLGQCGDHQQCGQLITVGLMEVNILCQGQGFYIEEFSSLKVENLSIF